MRLKQKYCELSLPRMVNGDSPILIDECSVCRIRGIRCDGPSTTTRPQAGSCLLDRLHRLCLRPIQALDVLSR